MKSRNVGLLMFGVLLLAVSAACGAEPMPIKTVLDNPTYYANKQVTISGVPANAKQITDPLSDYSWEYTVQDTTGTITVRTKGNPPSSDKKIVVRGTVDVSGGTPAILQQGGPGAVSPLLIAALAVLILLAVLLVFLMVRKPSPRRAAATVAAGTGTAAPQPRPAAAPAGQEFCDQCGSPKPIGQPCPKCAAAKVGGAAKPTTVEVKPESQATQLIETAPSLAWLAIREGDSIGKRFDVTTKGETVGRAPDNTISLDDSTVSRHHAKIVFENEKFFVHDLASANKTKVNGVEVVRQEINDGDEVEFGKVKMVFKRA